MPEAGPHCSPGWMWRGCRGPQRGDLTEGREGTLGQRVGLVERVSRASSGCTLFGEATHLRPPSPPAAVLAGTPQESLCLLGSIVPVL